MASDNPVERLRFADYPFPVTLHSPKDHTHTLIFLHGRGDNVTQFAAIIASNRTSDGYSLQQKFPGLKLVFPGAPLRQSSVHHRVRMFQWFDILSPRDPRQRQESQIDGLKESVAYIHKIFEEERRILGTNQVLLGGFSQGCATSAISMLLLDQPENLVGFVGMSGYLPFVADIKAAMQKHINKEFNSTNTSGKSTAQSAEEKASLQSAIRQTIQQILKLEMTHSSEIRIASYAGTPCFLGHGEADPTVPVDLGSSIADLLRQMGHPVNLHTYKNWGHGIKEPKEVDDLVSFLQLGVGMQPEEQPVLAQATTRLPLSSFVEVYGRGRISSPDKE